MLSPWGREDGSGVKAMLARWLAVPLWQRILGALVLGALAGWLAGPQVEAVRWLGDLFIRMIRMLIVPLVFTTLVAGIVSMEAPGRLASIGVKALSLYLMTTLAAVSIGILLAVLLEPGRGVDLSGATAVALAAPVPMAARMMAIVPENVLAAFADGDVLAVIFFAVLFGVGLMQAGAAGQPLAGMMTAAAQVMLKVTGMVMEFAPLGVFALVAHVMGTEGPGAFGNMLLLAMVVYLGGALHMLLSHAGLVRLLGRLGPLAFFKAVRAPQLMAYSTSSSAATLPVTLEAARTGLGVSGPVASAVLPLGATVNMDGTALYVAAVAVFSAQIFGIPLSAETYAMIALTTVLVSVGTASVPSASLFLMAAVLEVIGMSPAQTALVIGFVLPFDRVLDMWRTLVNVTGDLAVARAVEQWEGQGGRT